jgi:dGTPase
MGLSGDRYDKETMEYARSEEEKLEALSVRSYREDSGRPRREFERDYARVLYSSSFRRLQGKMQLLGVDHTQFTRNRLTHSLEVAQIARGIATDLNLADTFVVETCSLAHDLGNPPFGHSGESVLHRIAEENKIDGFEGNAQSFRTLAQLEKKSSAYRGLNLTLRTLLGVVKYHERYTSGSGKFLYDDDYEAVSQWAQEYGLGNKACTIDMQIMDLADEIAYGAHDLEDSLTLKYFSIDELLHEFHNSKYRAALPKMEEIVNTCRVRASGSQSYGSEEYSQIFRKELTSFIVNTLMGDLGLVEMDGITRLGYRQHRDLAKGLKMLTFEGIKRRPAVQLYEKQGEKVIQGLYQVYSDPAFNHKQELLPPEFRGEGVRLTRNIIDFIAGMMDTFALQHYEEFYGKGSLNVLYTGRPA